MKPNKLNLNKQTVSKLNLTQMNNIEGGGLPKTRGGTGCMGCPGESCGIRMCDGTIAVQF